MKSDKRQEYESLLQKLGKRPRIVLEKILENGSVSTYELGELGYDQPPRAAQDLKEAGVKLTVKSGKHPKTGANMAIYSLSDEEFKPSINFEGRRTIPKKFRKQLLEHFKSRCNVCNTTYQDHLLQVDHRIPYIIGGEAEFKIEKFQLLCAPHQRSKSWECEHCPSYKNLEDKNNSVLKEICETCFWAYPDKNYQHIATVQEKKIEIVWRGEDVKFYYRLKEAAEKLSTEITSYAKSILNDSMS